jgi:hypothetical protein
MRGIFTSAAGAILAAVLFTGTTDAADAPGVTADSIKIGMFAPLTGSAAIG